MLTQKGIEDIIIPRIWIAKHGNLPRHIRGVEDAAAEIAALFERLKEDINILLVMVIVLFAGLVVVGIMQVITLCALATVRGG